MPNEEKKSPSVTTVSGGSIFTQEKKSDPILDIPKIPFNVERHKKALEIKGTCETHIENTGIELDLFGAPNGQPGSGFGTAKFRELVKQVIQMGSGQTITTDASTTYGSPHLFYLYMGMAPNFRSVTIDTIYGQFTQELINDLLQEPEWDSSLFEELSEMQLTTLKNILNSSNNYKDKKLSAITLDDLVKNRIFFDSIKDKTYDFVSDVFIPSLLTLLSDDPKEKYPNTASLGATRMYLTEEGLKRWKYVIDNNLEFIPFKNLEHLNLTLKQQEQLQSIMEQRNVALSKNSS